MARQLRFTCVWTFLSLDLPRATMRNRLLQQAIGPLRLKARCDNWCLPPKSRYCRRSDQRLLWLEGIILVLTRDCQLSCL